MSTGIHCRIRFPVHNNKDKCQTQLFPDVPPETSLLVADGSPEEAGAASQPQEEEPYYPHLLLWSWTGVFGALTCLPFLWIIPDGPTGKKGFAGLSAVPVEHKVGQHVVVVVCFAEEFHSRFSPALVVSPLPMTDEHVFLVIVDTVTASATTRKTCSSAIPLSPVPHHFQRM